MHSILVRGRFAVSSNIAAASLFLTLVLFSARASAVSAASKCAPLPPPAGNIIAIADESVLRNQAYSAPVGSTLLLAPGVYQMSSFLHIAVQGLTIRAETGIRSDVVLDFGGMIGGSFGVLLDADDVTLANLTIRKALDHGVAVQAADRPLLYNLHIYDIGDQLVKVNPGGDGSQDGVLACSRLEYLNPPPDDYTNGISAHDAHDWVVRDNEWYNIRGPLGTTGPTILFWSGSSGTIVERNLIVDSYRGIAFGNPSHTGIDHKGGIVRNNMILFSKPHDVAIEMTRAQGWLVAYNTVLLLNPDSTGLTWGMEARYPESQGEFAYNLTNMAIWPDRDGANGILTGNITSAQTSWFVDPMMGNLHIASSMVAPVDAGELLSDVSSDFDGQPRPISSAPDVGADEFGVLDLNLQVYIPVVFVP